MTEWTLVIPVKALAAAKSRLAHSMPPVARHVLARAFALDTIEAAYTARNTARVIVVTGESTLGAQLPEVIDIVAETADAGLASAIEAGVATARGNGATAVAVLLGDLPALDGDGLDSALDAAIRHPLAFVRDADGTGTTLATARDGEAFPHAFGRGSAARHLRGGFVDLVAVDASAVTPGVRQDVDTIEALGQVLRLGVGSHTAAAVTALTRGQRCPQTPPLHLSERQHRDSHSRV